ncbi:hypothetical protein L596_008323 [Steinernema carpocapsae]|uniref:MPN domain-containing protein n=1 Tax=Steinernema carpocapsae TaxID=34508 RepID=A0A4V6XWL0_STECR|nr:hypothetical protein L596_008323 [Steinernema carpocapsae]
MTVKISPCAYSKVVLHSFRYPHCPVRGVLIAKKGDGNQIHIVDAIPVSHDVAALSAPIEIALVHIDEFCAQKKLIVAGVYFANEALCDTGIDPFSTKIAEKILAQNTNTVILQLDNTKLGVDSSSAGCNVFAHDNNKFWKSKKFHIENEEATLQVVSEAIQSKIYRTLADFETHLDSPTADFLNPAISSFIEECL